MASIAYFDSSAFVKLIVEEQGSAQAAAIWDEAALVVSSRLSFPEVSAALAAAVRSGRLDQAAGDEAAGIWQRAWTQVMHLELTAGIEASAGRLAWEYALRGADAVHLASALALRESDLVFVVWDAQLRPGAEAAGLSVAP